GGAGARRAPSDSGGLSRPLRAAVRVLHARHADDGPRPAAALPEPDARGNPEGPRRKHLPLHRLSRDRRRCRGRGRATARGAPARGRTLMATSGTRPRAVGRPVKRVEDGRLLAGQGRFVDDLHLPRMVHAAFVRSPHAHARVRHVSVSRALALPGVVAVLTADEAARLCHPWRGILTDYVGMKTALQYPLPSARSGTSASPSWPSPPPTATSPRTRATSWRSSTRRCRPSWIPEPPCVPGRR